MKNTSLLIFFLLLSHYPSSAQCWSKMVARDFHPLALKSDGTLWSWGGYSTSTTVSTPTQIGTDADWVEIATSGNCNMAIKSNGTLWVWGTVAGNLYGAYGNGTVNNTSPVPIQIGTDTNWKTVSLGQDFTIALKTDGTLWGWGRNIQYQLGQGSGDNADHLFPVQIGSATDWKTISTAYKFTTAIKNDSTLWCWGLIGAGTSLVWGQNNDYQSPGQVGTSSDWKQNYSYDSSTILLKNNGSLWAQGSNQDSMLGNMGGNQKNPIQIGTATDWKIIGAGWRGGRAIKTNGSLWCWGNGTFGQLGNGAYSNSVNPVQVGSGTNWLYAIGGDEYTLGIASDHYLWTWGRSRYGQLGDGQGDHYSNIPVQIVTSCNLAVTDFNTHNAIAVFPNPVIDRATVEYEMQEANRVTISIYNNLGQAIIMENILGTIGLNQLQFDLARFSRGIYFISIKTNNMQIDSKIIKK